MRMCSTKIMELTKKKKYMGSRNRRLNMEDKQREYSVQCGNPSGDQIVMTETREGEL